MDVAAVESGGEEDYDDEDGSDDYYDDDDSVSISRSLISLLISNGSFIASDKEVEKEILEQREREEIEMRGARRDLEET